MQGGSIVEQATTERLFAAPKHRHSADLLRAVPRLEVAP
jgi:ABC-type dipeptide/oligopeptide/nickel transport system ATPase component